MLQTKMQNHCPFSSNNIYSCMEVHKRPMRENSKENEQMHLIHLKQNVSYLVQTNFIKRIKLFLFAPYNDHLIN